MPRASASEAHSRAASRSRRGRSSRPTRVAKVCSAGPPVARRRRSVSRSAPRRGQPRRAAACDDRVDPALDQRQHGFQPGQRGLLLPGCPRARTCPAEAPPAAPPGCSGRAGRRPPPGARDVHLDAARVRLDGAEQVRRSHGTWANSRWCAASRSARYSRTSSSGRPRPAPNAATFGGSSAACRPGRAAARCRWSRAPRRPARRAPGRPAARTSRRPSGASSPGSGPAMLHLAPADPAHAPRHPLGERVDSVCQTGRVASIHSRAAPGAVVWCPVGQRGRAVQPELGEPDGLVDPGALGGTALIDTMRRRCGRRSSGQCPWPGPSSPGRPRGSSWPSCVNAAPRSAGLIGPKSAANGLFAAGGTESERVVRVRTAGAAAGAVGIVVARGLAEAEREVRHGGACLYLYVFHLRRRPRGPDHSMPTHGYLLSLDLPAGSRPEGDTAQERRDSRLGRGADHHNTLEKTAGWIADTDRKGKQSRVPSLTNRSYQTNHGRPPGPSSPAPHAFALGGAGGRARAKAPEPMSRRPLRKSDPQASDQPSDQPSATECPPGAPGRRGHRCRRRARGIASPRCWPRTTRSNA